MVKNLVLDPWHERNYLQPRGKKILVYTWQTIFMDGQIHDAALKRAYYGQRHKMQGWDFKVQCKLNAPIWRRRKN